jgi:hypothetical protein
MKVYKTVCAASLISLFAVCSQSCSNNDDDTSSSSTKITVETKPLTRLGYSDQNSSILTTWAANDALRIIPSNGNAAQVFTLTSGQGTRVGTFSGTAPTIGDGTYTVLYPSTLTSASDFDAFSYAGQQQNADADLSGIAAFHTVKLVSTTSDYTAISFSNAQQSSIMAMTFKKIPSSIGAPTQITLTADEACFATTNASVATEASLKLANIAQTTSLTAYMALGANTANAKLSSGKTLTVKITGDQGVCYHVFTLTDDVVFAGGKRNNINVSSWTTDSKPAGSAMSISTPTFEDGVTLDDSTTPVAGTTAQFGLTSSDGWLLVGGTLSYDVNGFTATSTSTSAYNRCNPYIKFSGNQTLAADGVIYYKVKPANGKLSISDAKISITMSSFTLNGVKGVLIVDKLRGYDLGIDKDGYQWIAFDFSKVGKDAAKQSNYVLKFTPVGGSGVTYQTTDADPTNYNAAITAFHSGTDYTYNRFDFVMISSLSDKTIFESFAVGEVGTATTVDAVKARISL